MKASENPLGTQLTAVITVCGCICLHLPALCRPLHLSLWSTVEMNKKSPFDRACLEFQYPLAKFITLRKRLHAHFHKLSLALFIHSAYPVNRRCQSTLHTTNSFSNLSSDRQNMGICINPVRNFSFNLNAFLSISKELCIMNPRYSVFHLYLYSFVPAALSFYSSSLLCISVVVFDAEATDDVNF